MAEFELEPPQPDGLVTPLVGSWSTHKHHFLRRYIHAFMVAMNKKGWGSLHYIDLFASAGIVKIQDRDELIWGSPLIAAQLPAKFSRLHLCEKNKKLFDALRQRVSRFQQPQAPQLLCGDANICVHDVVRELPPDSLSVAFLDPYGLHLHFSTLQALAQRRTDLILFFPDHLDALRNWEIYAEQQNSNLDRVLGEGVDWLNHLKKLPKSRWATALRELYVQQIRMLGYEHFDSERISRPDGVFLYALIFCCRHPAGGKIWAGIANRNADGQRSFDFGAGGT